MIDDHTIHNKAMNSKPMLTLGKKSDVKHGKT